MSRFLILFLVHVGVVFSLDVNFFNIEAAEEQRSIRSQLDTIASNVGGSVRNLRSNDDQGKWAPFEQARSAYIGAMGDKHGQERESVASTLEHVQQIASKDIKINFYGDGSHQRRSSRDPNKWMEVFTDDEGNEYLVPLPSITGGNKRNDGPYWVRGRKGKNRETQKPYDFTNEYRMVMGAKVRQNARTLPNQEVEPPSSVRSRGFSDGFDGKIDSMQGRYWALADLLVNTAPQGKGSDGEETYLARFSPDGKALNTWEDVQNLQRSNRGSQNVKMSSFSQAILLYFKGEAASYVKGNLVGWIWGKINPRSLEPINSRGKVTDLLGVETGRAPARAPPRSGTERGAGQTRPGANPAEPESAQPNTNSNSNPPNAIRVERRFEYLRREGMWWDPYQQKRFRANPATGGMLKNPNTGQIFEGGTGIILSEDGPILNLDPNATPEQPAQPGSAEPVTRRPHVHTAYVRLRPGRWLDQGKNEEFEPLIVAGGENNEDTLVNPKNGQMFNRWSGEFIGRPSGPVRDGDRRPGPNAQRPAQAPRPAPRPAQGAPPAQRLAVTDGTVKYIKIRYGVWEDPETRETFTPQIAGENLLFDPRPHKRQYFVRLGDRIGEFVSEDAARAEMANEPRPAARPANVAPAHPAPAEPAREPSRSSGSPKKYIKIKRGKWEDPDTGEFFEPQIAGENLLYDPRPHKKQYFVRLGDRIGEHLTAEQARPMMTRSQHPASQHPAQDAQSAGPAQSSADTTSHHARFVQVGSKWHDSHTQKSFTAADSGMRNLLKTPNGELFDTRTGNTIKPPANGSRYYTDAANGYAYNQADGEYFVHEAGSGGGQWATPRQSSSGRQVGTADGTNPSGHGYTYRTSASTRPYTAGIGGSSQNPANRAVGYRDPATGYTWNGVEWVRPKPGRGGANCKRADGGGCTATAQEDIKIVSSDPPPPTEEETRKNGFPGAKVTKVKKPAPLKTATSPGEPGPNREPDTPEGPHGVPDAPKSPELKPVKGKVPASPKGPKLGPKAPSLPPSSAPHVVRRSLGVRSRLFAAVA